ISAAVFICCRRLGEIEEDVHVKRISISASTLQSFLISKSAFLSKHANTQASSLISFGALIMEQRMLLYRLILSLSESCSFKAYFDLFTSILIFSIYSVSVSPMQKCKVFCSC